MRPEAANWLSTVEYDLETARSLIVAGRHAYSVFFSHLAVEKILKAIVVESTGADAPRTHDLQRLARLAGLQLSLEHEEFLAVLTDAQAGTRYPRDPVKAVLDYPEGEAREYLNRATEVVTWLRDDPRLKP